MGADYEPDTTALNRGVATQTPAPPAAAARGRTSALRPAPSRPAALQAERDRYGAWLKLGLLLMLAGVGLAFLLDWPVLIVALVAGLAAFSVCNVWLYRGKKREMDRLQSEAQEYLEDLS